MQVLENATETPMVVLAIDDAPADRLALRKAWEQVAADHRLVQVDGARAAIDYLESVNAEDVKRLPSLILTDARMEGTLTGLDVVRFVRAHRIHRLTPIVLLTGACSDEERSDAYAAGVNAVFVKPHRFAELRTTLGVLVEFWQRSRLPTRAQHWLGVR